MADYATESFGAAPTGGDSSPKRPGEEVNLT